MSNSLTKPLLPLRDIVFFPTMVVPLFVGREKSIQALQEVMKTDKSIVLVSQKNPLVADYCPIKIVRGLIKSIQGNSKL